MDETSEHAGFASAALPNTEGAARMESACMSGRASTRYQVPGTRYRVIRVPGYEYPGTALSLTSTSYTRYPGTGYYPLVVSKVTLSAENFKLWL